MKKRILCNLLVLALLLALLPTAALAGGDAKVVWSDDFGDLDRWETWTVVDANDDGYGFILDASADEGCTSLYLFAASPGYLGSGNEYGPSSDDYLVSPAIDLAGAWHEFVLSYDCRCVRPEEGNTPAYTWFEVFVIDADTSLTVESLRNLPKSRFTSEAPHEYQAWKTNQYDLTAYAGQQIRLVFHHKDASANRLELDNFQITDYQTDDHVEHIAVVGVPEPEVGLGVKDMREDGIRVLDSRNLSLVPGSVEYRKTVNESPIVQTGAFEDGAEYTIRFRLQPKEEAFLYSDAIASVNGRQAIYTLKDNGTPGDPSDDFIVIDYYFGFLHAKKQQIENAAVFLTPPVAGKTPDFNVRPDQDSFEPASVSWCKLNSDHSEGPAMGGADHFESGKTYRCRFRLMPREGFAFPEEPQVRINGEKRYPESPDPDGGCWCFADYTAAEDDGCTVRFFAGYCASPDSYTGKIGTEFKLPKLDDQTEHVFAGWSYSPYSGADEVISSSFRITHSCTLYAVWLEVLPAPEVRIAAPGVYRSVKESRVVVEKYESDEYFCEEIAPGEEIAWWMDPSKVGSISLRDRTTFGPGQTYYGMAYLRTDAYHCFAAGTGGLTLRGAVLDEAVADGQQMRITFHVTMPTWGTVDRADLFVDTLVAGCPVNESFKIPVYSLTPGLVADVRPGVYPTIDDAYLGTNACTGGLQPGQTYYGAATLTSSVGSVIDPDIKINLSGARQVGKSVIDEHSYLLLFAVQDREAYSLDVRAVSTDGSYPCGYLRSDLRPYWTSGMDGPYVPSGEHWFRAAALPGYIFLRWQLKGGETLGTSEYYSFALDDHMEIEALFGRGCTVTFMNAQGDDPPSQIVEAGKCATEPTGMTAKDFTFTGWYTDPVCQNRYDFTNPVVSDLILYSGWEYTPGVGAVDKTALRAAIAEAEALDTSGCTVESVTALAMVLTGAKMVLSADGATQADVDAAVENVRSAVAGLELMPGAVDKRALSRAIAEAEALDTSGCTVESVTALAMVLTGAKMVLSADGATQADVDAAVENVKSAVAGLEREEVTPIRFDDVKDPSQYYYEPVYWAVEKGVTTGSSPTTFNPNAGCTRAQVVTFLWRAAGKPEPARTENPFNDVKADAYYYKAVLWAVEKGVTTGTSDTTFRPDATCTRGQIVTFLWRSNDQPEPTKTDNPFTDVKADQYYYKAVLWAVEKGITKGTSDTRFSPDSTCTRGQIVTFLYRDKK